MIDRRNEVLGAPETEGSMTDRSDLVFHAFQRAVGEPQFGPGQDSVEMRPQHPDELLEWFQLGAHGGGHPFLQVLFGSPRLPVTPEQLKRFFEVITAHDWDVPADQSRQPVFLIRLQIPGILQQQPADPRETYPLLGSQAPSLA